MGLSKRTVDIEKDNDEVCQIRDEVRRSAISNWRELQDGGLDESYKWQL